MASRARSPPPFGSHRKSSSLGRLSGEDVCTVPTHRRDGYVVQCPDCDIKWRICCTTSDGDWDTELTICGICGTDLSFKLNALD